MNPIESLHHLKTEEFCVYREGVTLNRPVQAGSGSWVDIGLQKQLKLDQHIVPGTRVTIKVNEKYTDPRVANTVKNFTGKAVAPTEPKQEGGIYWGYSVRTVDYFSALERSSPYPEGYQIRILVDQVHGAPLDKSLKKEIVDRFNTQGLEACKHILVFFSGVESLGNLLEGDEHTKLSLKKALNTFDFKVKVSGRLGVKKIHIEEEMMIILQQIRELFIPDPELEADLYAAGYQ